jgi:hypothetical protein
VIISQHDHLYIFFCITCKKILAIFTCTVYTLYYKLNRGVHVDANADADAIIYNMQQNANITLGICICMMFLQIASARLQRLLNLVIMCYLHIR